MTDLERIKAAKDLIEACHCMAGLTCTGDLETLKVSLVKAAMESARTILEPMRK